MRPEKTDLDIVEELSEYFSEISDSMTLLTRVEAPSTYGSPWTEITQNEVIKEVRALKKPKSMVYGDMVPSTVNPLVQTAAIFLTPIINDSFASLSTAEVWRKETQTVIPKCNNSASFNELRNLSCTNLFSKLMEVFLLKRLSREVNTNRNQYGGIKGSGTNHFLINTYHNIMTALENNRNAVSIISVDFSKAFNRMDHHHCLRAFEHKGASTPSLQIIAALLRDRSMSIKVGNVLSASRHIKGGSPQGTKFGNFLFTVTID